MAKLLNLSELLLFQCKPNSKIPATPNGFKNAKINFDVKTCVANGFNVGLACEMSNIIVLDCDVDEARGLNGLKTLENLEKELGKLPNTLIQTTPRGGKHYFYSNKGITNPIGKICKDIDVKYKGYILIEPSKINSKAYKFIDGIDKNGEFIIADLPDKWITYLNKKNKVIHHSFDNNNRTQIKIHHDYNIKQIMEKCKFLQFCRNNAHCLDEPLWFSMISILSSVNNSDTLIHELSKPYPNYTYRETQQKINRAKKYGRPQTCKYISENYPLICKGCISSCQRGDL